MLDQARGTLVKADIYSRLMTQYTMELKYEEAVGVGKIALALLGIDLPETDREKALSVELARARSLLADMPVDLLLKQRNVDQDDKQIAIRLLANLLTPAYLCDRTLFALAVVKQVNLSLEFGHVSESASG